MKTLLNAMLLLLAVFTTQVNANPLLSMECLLDVDNKIGDMLIAMDGRFTPENKPPAGIDITTVKELPLVRHPEVKRLKFRVFETTGGVSGKWYRVRFTLSSTGVGICYIHGVDFMLLTPVEQSDSAIKSHNDGLYPPKKK